MEIAPFSEYKSVFKGESSSRDTLRDGKQATEKSMETEMLFKKYFWLSTLSLEFKDLMR